MILTHTMSSSIAPSVNIIISVPCAEDSPAGNGLNSDEAVALSSASAGSPSEISAITLSEKNTVPENRLPERCSFL